MAEFLLEHCGGWIDPQMLDRDRLERIPDSHITAAGERRLGDLAWRVGYGAPDRHLVVVFEFQSSSDADIARRIHEYGGLAVRSLAREGRLDAGGVLPCGLAVVVHTGARPWRPTGSSDFRGPPDPGAVQARMSCWSPCYSVDIRRLARRESTKETLTVWLGRAEDENRPGGLAELRDRVLARHPGRRFERFRGDVQLWINERAAALGVDSEVLVAARTLEEGETVITAAEQKRQALIEIGEARGRREGRAKGRAELAARVVAAMRGGRTPEEQVRRALKVVNGAG